MKWDSFRGHTNTTAILAQKAEVTSSLILYSLELPWDLIRSRGGSILGPTETQRRTLCDLETAALFLRLTEEVSSSVLSGSSYELFNNELLLRIVQKLASRISKAPDEGVRYLADRFDKYASYRKWISGINESHSETVLWEYARTVAAISGIEKDPGFNVALSWVLLRSFQRWELRQLLNEK